jgi:hypothetical protein
MTMRCVSVLLVAVVMAMMLSVGTALAHQSNNHKVCHVRDNAKDVTHSGLTHKEQKRELNRHPKDYAGACKGGGGAPNLGKIAAGPF